MASEEVVNLTENAELKREILKQRIVSDMAQIVYDLNALMGMRTGNQLENDHRGEGIKILRSLYDRQVIQAKRKSAWDHPKEARDFKGPYWLENMSHEELHDWVWDNLPPDNEFMKFNPFGKQD